MNSLVDRQMIDKLYEASQAGVQIRLVVRGICSLIPGVKGMSENIEVSSIVDQYLEHSRLFIFCNAGDPMYYLSSADWMLRSFDHRVEVATPIYDADVKEELRHFMQLQFQDTQKARLVREAQDNLIRTGSPAHQHRAQTDIHDFIRNGRIAARD